MDEEEEFRWLFAAEYPAVVRTVFFVIYDRARAEEIAQDAFVQLLRHWAKVRHYASPEAWVRRIAIRLAIRDARREQRLAQIRRQSIAEPPAAEPTLDLELLKAIRALPPRQRSVIALFYYEDRPMQEIAEILGCSTATGWVHLHRARKRLGALLTEEVTEDVS